MSTPYRSPPPLPLEVFDCILDQLHDDLDTLKTCCLVSKSLVSGSQRHIFWEVEFGIAEDMDNWKKTFPDPVNSPARYTRSLSIGFAEAVTAADVEGDGWVQCFSNLTRLRWNVYKSTPSQVLALIHSLPLLEDLEITAYWRDERDDPQEIIVPHPISPPLTGSLEICEPRGMEQTARMLLDLPNGIHFQKLVLTWYFEHDLRWAMALLERCSDTLERIDLRWVTNWRSMMTSVNLSKAPKLKEIVLRVGQVFTPWITIALKTITSNQRDLRISIHMYPQLGDPPEGVIQRLWADLDSVLQQLTELNGARTEVVYHSEQEEGMHESVRRLLPEVMGRGMIELVNGPCTESGTAYNDPLLSPAKPNVPL